MVGKNQSYARYLNNGLVMRELRENRCSATMLSQKLHLSNAALSAIIDELRRMGCIKEVEGGGSASSSGRHPVYYSVNEKFGVVAVVSLADYYAKVAISDMAGHITDEVTSRVERYDLAALYELVLLVKNLLANNKYRDIPLLGIDLSVPGMVNTVTGELQLTSQFDKDLFFEKNPMVNLFEKQFGVPVKITNDVNLALYAEMNCGLLKGAINGMLIHVDEGIGSALMFDGKLYEGSRGFAGEIGLTRMEFDGKEDYLDEIVSIRALKNKLSAESDGKLLHTDDIVAMYSENPKTRAYINGTAECLGKVLCNIANLLDISAIVLSGRVTLFGAEYLSVIRKEVDKSINGVQITYSELGRDAAVKGAIFKSVESLTNAMFKQENRRAL